MPPILIVLLVVVIVVAVLATILKSRRGTAAPTEEEVDDGARLDVSGYVKRPYLFTSAEFAFYKVLRSAVGDRFTILVKVRIADLVDVERGAPKRQAKLNRIMKKHVDFVLCDPRTMVPTLAIELDGSSHEADDRRERDALVDAIYAAVGLPCLHVPVAKTYEPADLIGQIDNATRR
jgi:very-short-patch-repair endonuclease